jgi:CheY-like chemotaxis protein
MARDADNRFEHGMIQVPNWLADPDLVVDDDRNLIEEGDRVLLVVEDDVTFARIMLELAHKRMLKVVIALRGGAAIALAREYHPHAITLDVQLPDMSGWTVLDALKHDPATRHVPVHVLSGHDNNRRGYVLGAMTCAQKAGGQESLDDLFQVIEDSMNGRVRRILLVTEVAALRQEIHNFLGASDLTFIDAASRTEAASVIATDHLDGIILDWVTSEATGIDFIEDVQAHLTPFVPPIIVFGSRKLTSDRASDLHRLSRVSAVRYAPSLESLLDESVLLLHRSEAVLTDNQRRCLGDARQIDPMLAGRKVLVIDDDIRNIFALTSVLEQRNLDVVHAENGRTGIETLQKNPDVDIVLMDIMMPEMDGYETMGAIRSNHDFEHLPIIALTAKAMKGDREKCLAAGASDYVTKPVDLDHLFSVMRVWLARIPERSETSASKAAE